jgi:glyoxylase-like metal-dependent hydrolase (beta-lactamase superfamily II)
MAILMRSLLLRAFSFFFFVTTAFAADDLILKPIQVAPHTYFVQGLAEMGNSKNQNFISNAGFVITPKGVIVVDALGSPVLAKKLIAEIKKITPQKVVAVIVTHYHADHVYGLQEFKKLILPPG